MYFKYFKNENIQYFILSKIWSGSNTICALISAVLAERPLIILSVQIRFLIIFILSAPTPLFLKPIKKNSAPGFAAQNLPNGYPRYPSFGDASSHPSSRHPSVGSARLPSVGEESTHPLLVAEEQVSICYGVTAIMIVQSQGTTVLKLDDFIQLEVYLFVNYFCSEQSEEIAYICWLMLKYMRAFRGTQHYSSLWVHRRGTSID